MALITGLMTKAPSDVWHGQLGHLSIKTTHFLANSRLVSLFYDFSSNFFYQSCHCNKIQRLLFSKSSLISRGPLGIVYIDVWVPSPVSSVDDFSFYVIFLDHFSKYVWLYP